MEHWQMAFIAALTGGLAALSPAAAQGPAAIGVDANPEGSSATSLGTIDRCVAVAKGDSFQVDIYIKEVSDLLAWEAYMQFDGDVVEVADRDVQLFQAANEGSDVTDLSATTPDRDGVYLLQAVDTADPASPDSGSGVLARVTLAAVGPGVSSLSLPLIDIDKNGTPDVGPFFRDVNGEIIGDDEAGDTLFDGSNQSAEVAVDEDCPGSSDGANLTVIVGSVAGGLAVLLVAGGLFFVARRRRRPSLAPP